MSRIRWALLILAAVGLVAGMAGVALASGSHLDAPLPAADPPASALATTPGPAPVAPAVATTSPDVSLSPVQAVDAWFAGGGTGLTDALNRDIAYWHKPGRPAMTQAQCQAMLDHARAIQGYEPVPDPEAQRHYGAALAYLGRAASMCVDAAPLATTDPVAYIEAAQRGGQDMVTAQREFLAGNERLRHMHGR